MKPVALPPPALVQAPGTCAVRMRMCVDDHRHHRRWSAVSAPTLDLFDRYLGRLGVGGFARVLGVGVRTMDMWLSAGLHPDKAADLAARLQLLTVHEHEAAGRCGCKACQPSSRERFRARIDQHGQNKPDRMRPGARVWCCGVARHDEARA